MLPRRKTLNCKGKLLDLSRPLVMGIINATPDSFFGESRKQLTNEVLTTASRMLDEGADILDIGGYSTRPGAEYVSVQEEMDRVLPMIEAVNQAFPDAVISIDSFRAEVARCAVYSGASMVNDVSGGLDDPEMIETVAALGVPYNIMHKKGIPSNMQISPTYTNVLTEVFDFLNAQASLCRIAGIHDLVLDPGFGFGKTLEHNYTLLKNLNSFQLMGLPILVGVSRKRMIQSLVGGTSEDALNGTTAVHMLALQHGANILRVHDVKEAKECIAIWNYHQSIQ